MYYNPDAQGQYASQFPTRGQGFLQPRGDIRTSIMPRNFQVLPADVQEVVDQYFHREELERRANLDEDEYMSIDIEAAQTVQWLQLHWPTAMALLQVAVHEALALATATRPQEQEYYYNSDDLVLDRDEEYPDLAEQVVQWQAAWWGAASTPPWQPLDFGQHERSYFDKLPDLRDLLNQAREGRAAGHIPVQSVAPMQLPFASVRDLDRQRQQCHDQTLAKWQSSPLDGEQRKGARTPPQPDPHDAPNKGCTQAQECEGRHRGHSKTRDKRRQQELDRARSKSQARSKSWKRNKSQKWSKSKKRSKSHRHDEDRECGRHEAHRPGVWSSQHEWEVLNQVPQQYYAERWMVRRASGTLQRPVEVPQTERRGWEECPGLHSRAHCSYLPHPCPRSWGCQMPIGVWWKGSEVCSRDTAHDRVGHPALEAPGAPPSAASAQVAPHAWVHANDDTLKRGIATDSYQRPFRGHSCALPCSVGLDGCAPPILAGSHNSPPIWWSLPSN